MKDKLTYRLLNWLDKTKAWELFFKRLSIYNLRFKGYPAFKMSDYFRIIDRSDLDHHYVFLSTDSKSLSSILIKRVIRFKENPGHFSHTGVLFFNGNRKTSIMHITTAGLIEQSLLDFLKKVDYFCVIKLPIEKINDNTISDRIKHIRGRAYLIKYDWEEQLDNGENLLYCSELVYDIFKNTVNSSEFKTRKILGRYVFDPFKHLNWGEIVYCNHPDLNKSHLKEYDLGKQTHLL